MVLQVYIYFTKIGVQTRMVFHTFSRFPRYFVFIRPLWFEVLYNQRFNRFFCCLYDVRSAYKYVIKSMIEYDDWSSSSNPYFHDIGGDDAHEAGVLRQNEVS